MGETIGTSPRQEIRGGLDAEKKDAWRRWVEVKIGIIKNIKKIIERRANLTPDELEEILKDKMAEIKSLVIQHSKHSGDDISAAIDRVEKDCDFLVQEADALDKQHAGSRNAALSDDKLLFLNDKFDALAKGQPDVEFILEVKDFFDSVLEKKRAVVEYQEAYERNEDEFWEKLRKDEPYVASYFDRIDIKKVTVEFSPLCVVFFVPSAEKRKKIGRSTGYGGVHFKQTIFNVVIGEEDTTEFYETVTHENNHNLTESFTAGILDAGDDLSVIISNKIKQIVNNKLEGDDLSASLNNLFRFVKLCLLENFSEITADLDAMTQGTLSSYVYEFTEWTDMVKRTIGELGGLVRDSELARAIGDGLLTVLAEAEKQFKKNIISLSDIFFLASRTKKFDEAQAAVILFGTERLEQAGEFVAGYSDLHVSESYQILRPALCDGLFFYKLTFARQTDRMKNSAIYKIFLEQKRPVAFFKYDKISRLAQLLDSKGNIIKTDGRLEPLILPQDRRDDIANFVNRKKTEQDYMEVIEKDPALRDIDKMIEFEKMLWQIGRSVSEMQIYFGDVVSAHLCWAMARWHCEQAKKSGNFDELRKIVSKWPVEWNERGKIGNYIKKYGARL